MLKPGAACRGGRSCRQERHGWPRPPGFAQSAPTSRLPVFDAPRIALLRALVTSPAFQQSLAVGAPPPPPADRSTRYETHLEHAQRVLRSFLALAGAHWTGPQRQAAEAAHSWTGFFDPDNITYVVNLRRNDVVDQIALWLQQAMFIERAKYDDVTCPPARSFPTSSGSSVRR